MNIKCENCESWDHKTTWFSKSENRNMAECRRHSPRNIEEDIMMRSAFPVTSSDDWCGEFKRRVEVPDVEVDEVQLTAPEETEVKVSLERDDGWFLNVYSQHGLVSLSVKEDKIPWLKDIGVQDGEWGAPEG